MRLREIARVPIPANSYSLYIRQRADARAQVFSLDYGEKLRIFDTSGSQKTSMPWSSKVRCIAVGDVEGKGEDALVGGVGKKVLVFDQNGKGLWKMDVESSVIACDARDIDGDDSAEVVAALQNKRVILWNHEQTALFSRNVDETIADVWLEDITSDSELEVVIAERNGMVTILTAAGYELKHLMLGNVITVFAVLTYGKRKLFVTGDHSPTLRIWDMDGNVIEQITLPAAPKALASGTPDDVSDLTYLVIATRDRKVSFWEATGPAKVTSEEKIILQEIESTKTILYRRTIKCGNCGAPTSPEAPECSACGAKLQVLGEYVIEQYIQDSIDSITFKHRKIKLRDLDTILRKTLPQPAAYNLRRSIQTMLKKRKMEGYFEDNCFIRTVKDEPRKLQKPSAEQVEKSQEIVKDLLRGRDTLEISMLEKRTGIDRRVLRHTLLILLGEGAIQGTFYGDEFTLGEQERPDEFVRKLAKELLN